jgi:hypothetical protein
VSRPQILDGDELVDFIDGRILAARVLRRGISTEDERRGYSQERALQEVRQQITGERLADDARCEHDWPDWKDDAAGVWRRCRRCEQTDYRPEG